MYLSRDVPFGITARPRGRVRTEEEGQPSSHGTAPGSQHSACPGTAARQGTQCLASNVKAALYGQTSRQQHKGTTDRVVTGGSEHGSGRVRSGQAHGTCSPLTSEGGREDSGQGGGGPPVLAATMYHSGSLFAYSLATGLRTRDKGRASKGRRDKEPARTYHSHYHDAPPSTGRYPMRRSREVARYPIHANLEVRKGKKGVPRSSVTPWGGAGFSRRGNTHDPEEERCPLPRRTLSLNAVMSRVGLA